MMINFIFESKLKFLTLDKTLQNHLINLKSVNETNFLKFFRIFHTTTRAQTQIRTLTPRNNLLGLHIIRLIGVSYSGAACTGLLPTPRPAHVYIILRI